MNTTIRPAVARRASRVRFDDEVSPHTLTNPPAIYTPAQRWSLPTPQMDYGHRDILSSRQHHRYSDPAAYSNVNSHNSQGMFRDPWAHPSSSASPQHTFFNSPEEISTRIRTSRVPYNNYLPVQSSPDSHDRRGSDVTLISDDHPYDKFTSLPPIPTRQPRGGFLHQPFYHYDYRHSDPSYAPRQVARPSRVPGQPLRSALRRSCSEVSHKARDSPTHDHGVVSKLMISNGLKNRRRASSVSTLAANDHDLEGGPITWSRPGFRQRRDSCMSTGSALLDADDPRVTGLEEKMNRVRAEKETEKAFNIGHHKFKKSKVIGDVVHRLTDLVQRQTFILRLAKALMYFGAPSHRIESQLISVSRTLEIDAQFVHMPSIVICSFGDEETKTSETHFVKAGGRLMLGKLHNVHDVYRSVVRGHMDAKEGSMHLSHLLKSPPLYSIPLRCFFAFLCCFSICPMAFDGSLADAFISGLGGALLCFLQLVVAHKNAMYADVFEISIAILMSFAARALSAIPGHVFCYQSISSSAVVLILPGYLILCSSLELASKNMLAGSVRMVYAIIYSLFLGFGLTIGSDLAFLIIPGLRNSQNAANHGLSGILALHGQFTADNSTGFMSSFSGSFSFANTSMFAGEENPESLLEGCVRNPQSVFLLQAFPGWTLYLLVPLYSFISSLWNLQPLRSRQLPVMVLISCASYAANKAANKYIFNRSDVVSAIGAFVVGLLGNIYSRLCGGTAFQVMSVGVSFLIPSGIAATGGLAQNYRNQEGDSYSAGLNIGLRMVQVGIGITVGLFGSGLVVYSFGTRKKNALFAF